MSEFTAEVSSERWLAKKNCASRIEVLLPAGATEAYEALRQRVLQPDGGIGYAEGRGFLVSRGLARFAQGQIVLATVARLDLDRRSVNSPPEIPSATGAELVKLVAGLILSVRSEGIHA